MKCNVCGQETNDCAILNDTIMERAKRFGLVNTEIKYDGSKSVACCRKCWSKM